MSRFLALSLLLPTAALAQAAEAPPAAKQASPPPFKSEQLDQLLAPVALYPDSLLAQVLMASTYPLEVVEAARWVQDPAHAKLKGDGLAAALEKQDWDPSVKALVPFPQVLERMNDKLEWTQKVGDAFLAQQKEVMASVQRLRKQAQAAGTLKSNEQQTVSAQAQTIVIEPASPQVVYVPAYDPMVVYGGWPYPAYPPVYFPPPAGAAFVSGFFFGVGIAAVGPLWGWCGFNWGRGYVNVNVNQFNRINVNRPGIASNQWQHDAYHRRGVAYRDPATRQKFGRAGAGAEARQNYRGRQAAGRAAPTGRGGAFEGAGRGEEARAHAERGQASRQAAAPRGGGFRGGGGGRRR